MRFRMSEFLVLLAMAISCHPSIADERPNILHILVDDVGYDDIGAFGAQDIQTPNLDKLAKNGVMFTNFYAPHSTCTTSRAALLTGRYVPRVNDGQGIEILWPNSTDGLDPKKEITVAKLLREAGYQTGLIGKWHLGDHAKYLPPKQGFDEYFGIPFPNDHGPERYWNMNSVGLDKIPVLEGMHVVKRVNNPELAELPHELVRRAAKFMRDSVAANRPFYLQYSNIETHTPWFVPMGFNGYSKAGEFGDAVEYMDRSVGTLLRQLKNLKQLDNTLVIFSSDNGPLVHAYPELEADYGKFARVDEQRASKRSLHEGKYQSRFEGGPRVAFIMSWPKEYPKGEVREQIVDGTDVFSTMLAAAGVNEPDDRVIDGHDLTPIAKSNSAQWGRNAFYSFSGNGVLMGVRVDNWKLGVPHPRHWSIKALKSPQLFDLNNDPKELNNIASKHPDIVERMMKLANDAKAAIKSSQPLQQRVSL